jgi:hypothetical protein
MGHVDEIAQDTAATLTEALSGLAVAPGEVEAASQTVSQSLSPPVAV